MKNLAWVAVPIVAFLAGQWWSAPPLAAQRIRPTEARPLPANVEVDGALPFVPAPIPSRRNPDSNAAPKTLPSGNRSVDDGNRAKKPNNAAVIGKSAKQPPVDASEPNLNREPNLGGGQENLGPMPEADLQLPKTGINHPRQLHWYESIAEESGDVILRSGVVASEGELVQPPEMDMFFVRNGEVIVKTPSSADGTFHVKGLPPDRAYSVFIYNGEMIGACSFAVISKARADKDLALAAINGRPFAGTVFKMRSRAGDGVEPAALADAGGFVLAKGQRVSIREPLTGKTSVITWTGPPVREGEEFVWPGPIEGEAARPANELLPISAIFRDDALQFVNLQQGSGGGNPRTVFTAVPLADFNAAMSSLGTPPSGAGAGGSAGGSSAATGGGSGTNSIGSFPGESSFVPPSSEPPTDNTPVSGFAPSSSTAGSTTSGS